MHSRLSKGLVSCSFIVISLSATALFAYPDTTNFPPKNPDKESNPKTDDSETKDKQKPAPRPKVRKTYTRTELLARTRMLADSRMPNMWGDFFDGTPYPLNFSDRTVFPPEWIVNGEGGTATTIT